MNVNIEKIGSLLTANWTKLLNFKEVGQYIIHQANKELGTKLSFIKTITCSRFDISKEGFVIWIDIITPEIKMTTELTANHNGKIIYNKSIKQP